MKVEEVKESEEVDGTLEEVKESEEIDGTLEEVTTEFV